jgi:hypothetical protein
MALVFLLGCVCIIFVLTPWGVSPWAVIIPFLYFLHWGAVTVIVSVLERWALILGEIERGAWVTPLFYVCADMDYILL